MITSFKIRPFSVVFSAYCRLLLRRSFDRVLIAGEDELRHRLPDVPTIFVANHSSWWDALLPCFLSVSRWKLDTYAMMDEIQLKKYYFFRWLGTFSVDRSDPRSAMRSIEYAVTLLKGTTRAMWIYPQGELLPNDRRPLVFYNGVEHIAKRVGPMNLVPVAFRFEFAHERRPDLFIRIGAPVRYASKDYATAGAFTAELAARLTEELDAVRSSILSGELGDFHEAMTATHIVRSLFDTINNQ